LVGGEANEVGVAAVELGVRGAGRLETGTEGNIILARWLPPGIAGELGVVERRGDCELPWFFFFLLLLLLPQR